jgi:adenylate cyclase
MTGRPGRLVLFCGVLPTLLVAALTVSRPRALTALEYSAYDAAVRATPVRPPVSGVVIVDVDERSLSAVGQWPWRRDLMAMLVERLRGLGASMVALDMVFAEPDRYTGDGVDADARLAETLRAGGVVLGYALTFDGPPAPTSGCVQHPLGLAMIRRGDDRGHDPLFRATGAICSLPLLTQAAAASGFLNAAPDPDGILRRIPLLIDVNERVHPGLALAAVIAARRTREMNLRVINVNAASLLLDGRAVPLDGQGNLLLRYRGVRHTFPYVSAAAVLAGQTPAGAIKDRIVFVGATALGTREVVSTPLDTLFAGVEVQATVADNLLHEDFIHRLDYGVMVETGIVLLLGVVMALAGSRFGLAWSGLAALVSLAAIWGGAIALLSSGGIFLSPLFPSLAVVAVFGSVAVGRFTLERRRADQAGRDKATSQRLMVQALLSLTEVRDAETGRHSRRTREYTRVLARQLATRPGFREYLTPERIDLLSSLAPLHDIGKVGVPDRLLNKPGKLTPEETLEMQKHPVHGRDVITHAERDAGAADDAILAMAKDIVYSHHEKWDGSGYPEGLRGLAIPIPARLIALVDVYDALTARRSYRDPMSHEEAVALIVAGSGSHFDPAVAEAFLEVSHLVRRVWEESARSM